MVLYSTPQLFPVLIYLFNLFQNSAKAFSIFFPRYLNYSEGPSVWLGDNSKEVHLPVCECVCLCGERLAGYVCVQIGAPLGGAPASLGGVCVGGIGALAGKVSVTTSFGWPSALLRYLGQPEPPAARTWPTRKYTPPSKRAHTQTYTHSDHRPSILARPITISLLLSTKHSICTKVSLSLSLSLCFSNEKNIIA